MSLFPGVAHWGDAQPITGVQVIAAIEDRHRLAEINAEITGQAYEPGDPAWDFSKALYAAACDPDVLRAYTSVAALTAMPADVLAEPGMLDKVISLGSAAPRYCAPGPPRPELLAAVA